jgi:cyclohexyl-isocyanide hydratase
MTFRFGILCYPQVQQLDLSGPYEVFASAKDTEVHLIWKKLEPVRSSTGLWLRPGTTFATAPAFDVVLVPGGRGVNALLSDEETLTFLRQQAATARFMTSVCTGSLLLGKAGLLRGRRATTHWNAHDLLSLFGAFPANARVVKDGSIITAGGITSGIDFGLAVVAELMGKEEAQVVQLMLEYAPAPPFSAGRPEAAPESILTEARKRLAESRAQRERLLR